MRRVWIWSLCGVVFAVLATANAAGYRYGASDQAFYIPAVVHALDPASYPRDGSLLDAQAHLMVGDEILAAIARVTHLPLEVLFFCGYLLSLALTWTGLVLVGTRLYDSRWGTVALGAAFTLRHRIPQTSANSFEPYFHPRMLAFAVGLLALGAVLRDRRWFAIGLVAGAAVIHVTTALWFAILIGVALAILDRRLRHLALAAGVAAAAFLAWTMTEGPLHGSFTRMDAVWLQAVSSKDSLFPTDWPAWVWVANLGLLAMLWTAHLWRRRRAPSTDRERALAWGATALVAIFLLTLPLVSARFALPVQLQISRIFWLLDVLATAYLLAAIASMRHGAVIVTRIAGVLLAASVARGVYVMAIEHPERALVAIGIPDSSWKAAMDWLATQPRDVGVLADPGHAWKYGTSVRVAARRDVFLEEVKDAALAIYSRDVAGRVVERSAAIGDFATLTADRALDLASRYEMDYLVTVRDLPLPPAYRNRQFTIYRLSRRDRRRTDARTHEW